MSATLDAIDRRILDRLQADGSLSIAELADELGMTAPPCWRRVRRLKDAGVLRQQVWTVDPTALGLTMTVYANVKLAGHDAAATAAFRERIAAWPEVLECYILLGTVDVLIKMVVRDIQEYERVFFERLSQLPGVREVNSSVVVSVVKQTSRLPTGG